MVDLDLLLTKIERLDEKIDCIASQVEHLFSTEKKAELDRQKARRDAERQRALYRFEQTRSILNPRFNPQDYEGRIYSD